MVVDPVPLHLEHTLPSELPIPLQEEQDDEIDPVPPQREQSTSSSLVTEPEPLHSLQNIVCVKEGWWEGCCLG